MLVYRNVSKRAPLSMDWIWNFKVECKDAVLPVDFVRRCRVICRVQKRLQIQRGCTAPVDSCRKRTSSSSFSTFFLCCWHLLSLQSCNRCHSHVVAKRQTEIMVGNQLSCLYFLVDFVAWRAWRLTTYLLPNWSTCVPLRPPVWSKYLERMRTHLNFRTQLNVSLERLM
jgi:hypothetical protein